MRITLENAGRRFNYEWILKNITYTFQSGTSYAILGPNGSGKSTLLQMIAGNLSLSAGRISYNNNSPIDGDEIFRHLSIAAPYLELVEEFTLEEQVRFQQQFKGFSEGITVQDFQSITQLKSDPAKQIRHFSSGMKQRLKLGLALLADVPMVLLDEPTTNLDQKGFEWYLELVNKFSANRLLIICSNLEREYSFCTERIDVTNYK
jgi:ABC-type multidrug transport system ATPase subunit